MIYLVFFRNKVSASFSVVVIAADVNEDDVIFNITKRSFMSTTFSAVTLHTGTESPISI